MAWRPVLTGGLIVAAVVALGVAVTGNSPVATTSTVPASTAPAAPRGTVGPVAKPTALHIPSISVNVSDLVPLGIQGQNGVPVTPPGMAGNVEVPPDNKPAEVGYFSLGFLPGQIGSAVMLGHVDSDGVLGSFHDLGMMRAGDKITVDRADGTSVNFTVTTVKTILKKDFNDQDVYGPKPDAELRLVSCGGKFIKASKQYDANVIVTAVLSA